MFGKFGIVISDVYIDESKDNIEVVDLWFLKGATLYMIPVDRLKLCKSD